MHPVPLRCFGRPAESGRPHPQPLGRYVKYSHKGLCHPRASRAGRLGSLATAPISDDPLSRSRGDTLFAVCAPGLEAVAAQEIAERGFGRPRAVPGGVLFEGSPLAANRALATPSRILLRLSRFEAPDFGALQRGLSAMDLRRFGGLGFTPEVSSRASRLYHTGAIAERLADGLLRRLPGVTFQASARAEGDDPATGPGAADEAAAGEASTGQLVVVRLERDEVLVSLDTSGDLLSRRGYRQATAKAPLRENLAAALLAAAGWRGEGVLIDPFCGAGTIAIEAAEIALGLQPGRNRSFACERWPALAKVGARSNPEPQRGEPVFRVLASDRAQGALDALIGNAERAGVRDVLEIERADFLVRTPPAQQGFVVTNPPYGVRVRAAGGGKADPLASRLRQAWAGWRTALLVPSASPGWARAVSSAGPLGRVFKTRNGGLDVALRAGTVAPHGPGSRKRSP